LLRLGLESRQEGARGVDLRRRVYLPRGFVPMFGAQYAGRGCARASVRVTDDIMLRVI
jgi:hypothetical protein